jgi:hypothetical protein
MIFDILDANHLGYLNSENINIDSFDDRYLSIVSPFIEGLYRATFNLDFENFSKNFSNFL